MSYAELNRMLRLTFLALLPNEYVIPFCSISSKRKISSSVPHTVPVERHVFRRHLPYIFPGFLYVYHLLTFLSFVTRKIDGNVCIGLVCITEFETSRRKTLELFFMPISRAHFISVRVLFSNYSCL